MSQPRRRPPQLVRPSAWLLAAAVLVALLGVASGGRGRLPDLRPPAVEAATLPALPAGWPSTFQLGMSDDQITGAATNSRTAPFGFRYKYLTGDVNGWNWLNWGSPSGGSGGFVRDYIQQSAAHHMIPVFTWYMITDSAPNGINNLSTSIPSMAAYYRNLIAFLRLASQYPRQKVVLHVEPDLWGYIEQGMSQATPNASLKPAEVSNTGLPELAGLPNDAAGFAQAFVRLRDLYAPNVILAYHISIWGSNDDIIYSKPSDSGVIADATRVATFYRSLKARFDIAFGEFRDRDAGFYQYQQHDPNTWYCTADFDRHALFMSTFSRLANLRIVLWQIAYGNNIMRAENNTWDQYQDNKVQSLIGDPTRVLLSRYLQAGVVALLFGRGANGTSGPDDLDGDGVDNPAPITTSHCGVTTTNQLASQTPDDDGGYFRQQAAAFYSAGPISLAGGYAPPIARANFPGPVAAQRSASGTPARAAPPAPSATAETIETTRFDDAQQARLQSDLARLGKPLTALSAAVPRHLPPGPQGPIGLIVLTAALASLGAGLLIGKRLLSHRGPPRPG